MPHNAEDAQSDLPPGVHVRAARFEDLQEILDINQNIFNGNDYMATCFYTMMHDPEHYPYVLEVDREIVSTYSN